MKPSRSDLSRARAEGVILGVLITLALVLAVNLAGCTSKNPDPEPDPWLATHMGSYIDKSRAQDYTVIGPFVLTPVWTCDPNVRIIGVRNDSLVNPNGCDSIYVVFPLSGLGTRKMTLFSRELTLSRDIVITYYDDAESTWAKRHIWAK